MTQPFVRTDMSSKEGDLISRAWRLAALLAAGTLAALAALAAPGRADDDSESQNRIAFHSNQTGNNEIFVMGADGANPINLTNNPAADVRPAWSPDGRKIAFSRGSGFARELYVMDVDGTNQTQLTFNAVSDQAPTWSPDGKKIAFARFGPDLNVDIYTMNADGTEERALVGSPAFDGNPDWSRDGKLIAFESDRGGFEAVYAIRPNGSGLRRLTAPALQAGDPSWSPDGDKIALLDNHCGTCPESDLFVLELEDGKLSQLTDTADNEQTPDWSPGGKLIAYASGTIDVPEPGVFGPTDIYVIGVDGGQPLNLTNSPTFFDFAPDWEPESR